MQPNTFSINLDLINHEYVLVDGIKVTSGDTEANVFNINLIRDFVPVNLTGITAVIVFLKPDRKIVYQNLTPVDLTTGKFTCTLSSQTIVVPGEVKSEVVLYEGTKRLTSTRFKFIVKKGLLDETAVESSNEFTALTEALGTVNQYDSRITTVEQDQAAHEADLVTDEGGVHGLEYEEGTWTPVIIGTTTAGTGTYTANVGRYTKIGNRIVFTALITWTAHDGTGNIKINGLPFVSANISDLSVISILPTDLTLIANNILSGYVEKKNTTINLIQYPTGGGGNNAVSMDTSATLKITGSYQIA